MGEFRHELPLLRTKNPGNESIARTNVLWYQVSDGVAPAGYQMLASRPRSRFLLHLSLSMIVAKPKLQSRALTSQLLPLFNGFNDAPVCPRDHWRSVSEVPPEQFGVCISGGGIRRASVM
jgi:hypothetical protein